jgi:hypothetical protein
VTWVQRHVEPTPPGRLWAVVLAGPCPAEDCPYPDDEAHAHHVRDDGSGFGISTSDLTAIGAVPR